MTHLYSCRHDGDQYRITKWNADMNVEASYLTTLTECNCPAGSRDTCRHRQMLPRFISREAVDTNWFYDHDRGGWVQIALPGAEPGGDREQALSIATYVELPADSTAEQVAKAFGDLHSAAEPSDSQASVHDYRRGR